MASSTMYRVGLEEAKNTQKMQSGPEPTGWFHPDLKYANKLDSMEWLLGRGPAGHGPPSPRCSLEGMFFPIVGGLRSEVMSNYLSHHSHANEAGLTDRGAAFAEEMMKHGMLIDTDHMAQRTRLALHQRTRQFGQTAWGGAAEYPVHGIHSDLRGYTRHGPVPIADDPAQDFRDQLGWGAETDKTTSEVARIAAAGGAISPGVNGVVIQDLDGIVSATVNNDCDYSSKAYAAKYLLMVKHMKGKGVTPSTDMNSPSPRLMSRFGAGTACMSGDTAARQRHETWKEGGEERPILPNVPRDWTSELYDRCRDNISKPAEERDPGCPSTGNPVRQFLEFSGVEYDDYSAPGRSWSTPWAVGDPNRRGAFARRSTELRDDGAAPVPVDQGVTFGGGGELKQMRPLRKWRGNTAIPTSQNTGWDVNLDGLMHVGMLPDVWQDMRNVGVTWEHLTPMFNSANDYVEMWERSCRMARDHALATGELPKVACK